MSYVHSINSDIKSTPSSSSYTVSSTSETTGVLQGRQAAVKRTAESAFSSSNPPVPDYKVKINELFKQTLTHLTYNPNLSPQELRDKTKLYLITPLETLLAIYPYDDLLYFSVTDLLTRLHALNHNKTLNFDKILSNNLILTAANIQSQINLYNPYKIEGELSLFIRLFWQNDWTTICEFASECPEIEKKPALISPWIAAELLKQECAWKGKDELTIQCALMELKSFSYANASQEQLNQFIRGLQGIYPKHPDPNFFRGSHLNLAYQTILALNGLSFNGYLHAALLPMLLRMTLQSITNNAAAKHQCALGSQVQTSTQSLTVKYWMESLLSANEDTLLTPKTHKLKSGSKIVVDRVVHMPSKQNLSAYTQDVTQFCSLACDVFFTATRYSENDRIQFFKAFFGYIFQCSISQKNYILAKTCVKSALDKLKDTNFFDKSPRAILFMNKNYRELLTSCEKADDHLSIELYVISKRILNMGGLPKLDTIFPSTLKESEASYLNRIIRENSIHTSSYSKKYPLLTAFLALESKRTPETIDPILYPYLLEKLPQ